MFEAIGYIDRGEETILYRKFHFFRCQDTCINICEMKFSNTVFTIDKSYAAELGNKLQIFQERTDTKKTLFLTMVTTYGTKDNSYKTGLVQNEVTMKDLFKG